MNDEKLVMAKSTLLGLMAQAHKEGWMMNTLGMDSWVKNGTKEDSLKEINDVWENSYCKAIAEKIKA